MALNRIYTFIVLSILFLSCDDSGLINEKKQVILEWEITDRLGEVSVEYDTLNISMPISYKLELSGNGIVIPNLDTLLVDVGDHVNINGYDLVLIHKDNFQNLNHRLIKKISIEYKDKGVGYFIYASTYGIVLFVPYHGDNRKRLVDLQQVGKNDFKYLSNIDSLTNEILNDTLFIPTAPPSPLSE